jgi:2-polyprenyl-6-methoxyphenol hydroxylase-like FAD-dependent oxidoreductase
MGPDSRQNKEGIVQKRALVVGLGVAGMATATGLRQAGWTPVIVERAPERRTGGYFVGLMSEGRQAAIDLGIADQLHTRNPSDGGKAWSLDRRGNREPGVGFLHQPGDPAAVLRGDVEAALWQGISGVDVRFASSQDHRSSVCAPSSPGWTTPRCGTPLTPWSRRRTSCSIRCTR